MSVRTQRVAKLMHREIAGILAHEFPDKSMVTVIGVRVTHDLSTAQVDVSILVDSAVERQDIFDALVGHSSTIRKLLAQRIRHQMRAVPNIRFSLDNSQEAARKIDLLLERIKQQKNSK
jgi:ribosome-binding factor A